MPNMDRFDSYIVDEYGKCDECGNKIPYSDALFDEYTEKLYCSEDCVTYGVERDLDVVIKYYIRMNVGLY